MRIYINMPISLFPPTVLCFAHSNVPIHVIVAAKTIDRDYWNAHEINILVVG